MSKKYLSEEGFTGKGIDLRMRRVRGKIYIDVRISNGEDEAEAPLKLNEEDQRCFAWMLKEAYDYRQGRRVKKAKK
jgi:hypothetical protein